MIEKYDFPQKWQICHFYIFFLSLLPNWTLLLKNFVPFFLLPCSFYDPVAF